MSALELERDARGLLHLAAVVCGFDEAEADVSECDRKAA